MITVHNLDKGVAKPMRSSIIGDSHLDEKRKAPQDGGDGWQAYSGKSTVTWPSPTAVNEEATKSANNLKSSSMDIVNRARYCDIAIGTGSDDLSRVVATTGKTYLLSASAFGNWRKKDINCFSDISERVMLQTDERPKAEYSIKYELENAGDTILKSDIAKKVSQASQLLNTVAATAASISGSKDLAAATITNERASLYQNFPLMKLDKTTTEAKMENITFKFRFGQAGIFSGEEEVVKPILALAGPWALKTGDYHSVMGPYPTVAQASRRAVIETINQVISNGSSLNQVKEVGDGEDGGFSATNLVKEFNEKTDKLYKIIDDVAKACFNTSTTITFIVGGLVMGPFIVGNVSWNFNFDNVDEYGYPCEGSFTFAELKPIRKYVNSDYARQWGYDVELAESKNPVAIAQANENSLSVKQTMAAITGGREM